MSLTTSILRRQIDVAAESIDKDINLWTIWFIWCN